MSKKAMILFFVWWLSGASSFIFWWTHEHNYTVADIPFTGLVGITGPFTFVAGCFIHGPCGKWDMNPVLIPKQAQP